jgi:cytochrome P450
MSQAEIERNANVLVIAGSETTATLLSGLTYYLAQDHRVWSKLAAEIRSQFHTEEELTFKATTNLPYLNAVLEEGLRLYPPVPLRLPRVTGPQGHMIDGYKIPPGVSIHRNS